MKMVFGGGASITDYQSFVYNYTLGQFNYKIPINGLGDLQLYVPLWEYNTGVPGSQTFQLIHTCGSTIGTIETITPSNYVAGLDPAGKAYMVISGFVETTTAQCWVVAATLDGNIWFSQEYSHDGCGGEGLNVVLGCYGNLDPLISYDSEGIYFGQSQNATLGDATLVYQHFFLMRSMELTLQGIKNEFKQGRTRNFRTESSTLYLFWGELIPDWYMKHIDAVFKRGEVLVSIWPQIYSFPVTRPIDGWAQGKYLVDSTGYEKVDECTKSWKPTVTLKENFYNSFSCEVDPCSPAPVGGGGGGSTVCCVPTNVTATVESNGEGGQFVCVLFTECEPSPANGYTVYYRVAGTTGAFLLADTGYGASPACFNTGDPDGTNYEGYIFADCGGGLTGSIVNWSTGSPETYTISSTSCSGSTLFTEFTINGGTPGDTVTVRLGFSGTETRTLPGNYTRAHFSFSAAAGTPSSGTVTDPNCYTDFSSHGFNITQDIVFVLTGTSVTFQTSNVAVDNSPSGFQNFSATIIDVNGTEKNISASGCHGNSANGGTC